MPTQTIKEILKLLNGYFDKIYIISLKRSENRQEIISELFPGLQFEYFWGIDGRDHTQEDFIKKGLYNSQMARYIRVLNNQPNEDMLTNAVACALSHLGVYRDMLDNGLDRVLILEDDIILGDNATPASLRNGIEQLPDNWDLFYLGHLDNNLEPNFSTLLRLKIIYPFLNYLGQNRYDPIHLTNKFPAEYSDALKLSGYHYGAHAYGISAAGAKKLLQYQTPVTREIDVAIAELCRFRFINAFSLKERLFFQNRKALPSMIEEGRFKQSTLRN